LVSVKHSMIVGNDWSQKSIRHPGPSQADLGFSYRGDALSGRPGRVKGQPGPNQKDSDAILTQDTYYCSRSFIDEV
jgi:hypothetical protein